jgi:small-conductance mechanosensitive channel
MEDTQSENFFDSSSANFLLDMILNLWRKIDHLVSFVEIGMVIGFVFLSFFLQKWVTRKYESYLDEKRNPSFHEYFTRLIIEFGAPFFTFVLLSFAMALSITFTHHVEIYRLSIQLTFVWMVWIFVSHAINDVFVRWVVTCTLIPLLIFAALGLATPVVSYLDSLSFFLGETRISIFLILKGVFIATCLAWGARFIIFYINRIIENQKKISIEVRDLMENLFQILLYTTVALITLNLLGIDLKSLAIVGGAVGIGIGLGLQKIAANFISGIIILFEQHVKVGHLVEVPGGGNPGWIRHLGTRAAVLDTGDGKEILIPNEELLTKSLIDWTSRDRKIRIDLSVKVSFESDLELAKKIMLEAILNHPSCSKTSPPSCFLQKFTDNGAQFLLQYWIDDFTAGSMDMQNDVLFTIWKYFSKENIKFPTPLSNFNVS